MIESANDFIQPGGREMNDPGLDHGRTPAEEITYSIGGGGDLTKDSLSSLSSLDKKSEFEITDGLPRVRLIFFRHGQHPESVSDHDPDLTGLGAQEAQDLGHRVQVNERQSVGFYIDNLRSLMSMTRVMEPDAPEDSIHLSAQNLIKRYKIKTDPSLNYKVAPSGDFRRDLDSAVETGRVLRFLVEQSDNYDSNNSADISTYSSIGRECAKIIKKYTSVEKQWVKINQATPYADKNLYRLFCAREFIVACMRAKLTEHILGIDKRNEFVDWYEQSVENNGAGRAEYTIITVEPGKAGQRIILTDNFGRLEFNPQVLDEILLEPSAVEPAAYVVPIRVNPASGGVEVALVHYQDGFGFIGGRLQGDEIPDEALRREVLEELGGHVNHHHVVSVPEVYDFEMAKDQRPGKNKHREHHHFYVSLLGSGRDLHFQEAGAKIEWVPVASLLDESIIVHEELRAYLRRSVMPVIDRLVG